MDGDTFIDILENRRNSNDIAWALKEWNVPPCKYSLKRKPQEIKKQVLSSSKLKQVIHEVSKERGCPPQEVEAEASSILDEMAHNFQLKTIRFFGYTLSKFMKSVYGKILVNKKGAERIAGLTDYPILYLPTHRSYSDFLLVSYVAFYFNLPLPVIAAGLDFLGLKFLSFLLRGAGAFFIRRSFVGDSLYRTVFTEYVQSHLEGGDFPMEFFIEGTRSRSAKSLSPKLGMMQVILELFFSSKIPDLMIVPISISYERTLEESLYAYELLGVPKPKESTKSLFKARKVMSDYFGNVYIRFGQPISLKEHFRNYDRSVHNRFPRNLSVVLKTEQQMCHDLTHHIIRMHQCNLVLSPFPLVCLLLSQGDIHFNVLVDHIDWLEELVRTTGALIYTGHENLSKLISDHLKIHRGIVEVRDDFIVSLKEATIRSSDSVPRLRESTLKQALPAMCAGHYANQALQLLVHMCMICLSILSSPQDVTTDDIFHRYSVLRQLLQREFVFERDTSEKDFSHALQSLCQENILMDEGHPFAVQKLQLLATMLIPFLNSYMTIVQCLIGRRDEVLPDAKKLSLECQGAIERALVDGSLSDPRCLSLDTISNCIALLVIRGALIKSAQGGFLPSHPILQEILLELDMFLPGQGSNTGVFVPAAKL